MAGSPSSSAGNGTNYIRSGDVEQDDDSGAAFTNARDEYDRIRARGRAIGALDDSRIQDNMMKAAGRESGTSLRSTSDNGRAVVGATEQGRASSEPQSGKFELGDEGTCSSSVDNDDEGFSEPPLVDDDLVLGPDGHRIVPPAAPPAVQPAQPPPAATIPAPMIAAPAPVAAAPPPPPVAAPAPPPIVAPAAPAPPLPAPDAKGFWSSDQATAHSQWHDFHHKGHGQWSLCLPPPGSDPRTGAKGPGAAQWKLANPLKPRR